MSAEENRKRIQELRWVGFQRLLAGIAIIFGVSCVFFIFLDEQAGSRPHYSYSSGKALGLLLFAGVWGLWNIVRGIIYLIRAQSGDEHYAKKVVDTMDKVESKQEEVMGKQIGKDGSLHNVLVLLVWIFLFLAVIGAICIGYLFWTKPT